MPKIEFPKPHDGQMEVARRAKRYNVIQCGRRWGKTTFLETLLCQTAIEGFPVGWFAPTYKYIELVWSEVTETLRPVIARQSSQSRRIELTTGGSFEFWTLDSPDPGRSRKYKRIGIDESGFARSLLNTWHTAIRPTLTDLKGDAWFVGTPKGRRDFHELYSYGEQGKPGWMSFRRPTVDNPIIDPAEVEEARLGMPKSAFEQEYLGIPADDGGNPFGIEAIGRCFRGWDAIPDGEPVCWGVDLAKSQDWTVAIGLAATGAVVRFERWQGVPWPDTIQRLARLIGPRPAMVDSTGVGDPIVDMLQRDIPRVEGYHFSSQSKQRLMEGLAHAIQSESIVFADPVLKSELDSFGYEYTKNGVRYSAPDGLHDDSVCALALAVHLKNSTPSLQIMSLTTGDLIQADKGSREDRLWRPSRGQIVRF